MRFKRVRRKMEKKLSKFVCDKCKERWQVSKKAKHEPCFDFLVAIDIVRKTK
jgi:predicted metal-binding protein